MLFVFAVFLLVSAAVLSFFAAFPRPYRDIVGESGLDGALVYSVMKAESNFREDADSDAGAVGIMQLCPRRRRSSASGRASPSMRRASKKGSIM